MPPAQDAVGAPARAQAPRREAVRGDGARPGGGRSAGDPRRRAAAAADCRSSGRSCWRARASGDDLAPNVAPRNAMIGLFLPYTPLHHLLLAAVGGPLVMTSGNRSDEPIAFTNDDARGAAGRDRRPVPVPRPRDRDALRRLGGRGHRRTRCRPAPVARLRAARGSAAARRGAAGARLRRAAEEHVLPRRRRQRVARPAYRRSRQPRDLRLVPRRPGAARALPAGPAGDRRARHAPGLPVDDLRAAAARPGVQCPCSTITRTWSARWPSTVSTVR